MALPSAIVADDLPTTGEESELSAPLDKVVLESMDLIGARAAVLAVSYRGHVVVSRGYGWADRRRSKPTQPTTTFRLASNSKPITAAITRELIRHGKLDSGLKVFQYLELVPFQNQLGDERLKDVTVQHLLDHKGGWDRDAAFDPMYQLKRIQTEMRVLNNFSSHHVIQYMLSQPLQLAPGEKRAYSNFGYVVLGRVIEKQTGESYGTALQSNIGDPLGLHDIHVSGHPPNGSNVVEVFYPDDVGFDMRVRDSAGGLAASAPSICEFLNRYWISGEPRKPRQRKLYWHFGSLPNTTTALMEQRPDGIDYAVMFNARRNEHYVSDNDHLRSELKKEFDLLSARIKGQFE
ncbi:MAG: beta-lactamase family protein [Planctomycetaceae bacterium]|nr:beta-lactamase family protein [Planctomycetaceae bacterium]